MFKHLSKTFETLQIAVTFAEAGEAETARRVLQQAETQAQAQPASPRKAPAPVSTGKKAVA